MLANILAFLLFIGAACSTGEMTILHHPQSILFVGKKSLDSSIIGDVILATLGHDVPPTVNWQGLVIKDPFKLAQTTVLIVHVRGIFRIQHNSNFDKTYNLEDSAVEHSYDAMITQLNGTGNETVHDINFRDQSRGITAFKNCFGNLVKPTALATHMLKPLEYITHKHIVDDVGYLDAAAKNLANVLKPSQVIIFRISLDRLARVSDFATIYEAKTMIATAISKLLNAAKEQSNSLLFVQTTDKNLIKYGIRVGSGVSQHNPFRATMKDKDFPVIFNATVAICLAFVLALASICYVIATIDPGRDSVLYRVSNIGDGHTHTHHRHHHKIHYS